MKSTNLLKLAICSVAALYISTGVAETTVAPNPEAHVQNAAEELNLAASEGVEKTKEFFSDSDITAKVKEKFIAEKMFGKEKIAAMGIHVKTTKGVVLLTGKVASKDQEDTAISLAKAVEGVSDVVSKIKVKAEVKK